MHECPLSDASYKSVSLYYTSGLLESLLPTPTRAFFMFCRSWQHNMDVFSFSPYPLLYLPQALSSVQNHVNQAPHTCPTSLPCMHCHQHADFTWSEKMLDAGLPIAAVAVRLLPKKSR
jgi:hypothetical protein